MKKIQIFKVTNIVVILFAVVSRSSVDSVNFLPVTFPNNGSNLRASDPPAQVVSLIGNPLNITGCVPGSVQCSLICQMKSNCSSFNFRADTRKCEFFSNSSNACSMAPQCTYFRVTNYLSILILFNVLSFYL